jgi:Raf kinase inhibitor-like YbhB/YbcL family protein
MDAMTRHLRGPATLVALAALAACGSAGAPPAASKPASTLTVTSTAFADGAPIPAQYTCTGGGAAPTVSWSGDLRGATAVAVVVDDPDAPGGTFVHRVVVDIPVSVSSLGASTPAGAHEARNSAGTAGWTPPCPPSGTHHYRFTVYGLGAPTKLADGVPAGDAIAAIQAGAVTQGRLTGLVSH